MKVSMAKILSFLSANTIYNIYEDISKQTPTTSDPQIYYFLDYLEKNHSDEIDSVKRDKTLLKNMMQHYSSGTSTGRPVYDSGDNSKKKVIKETLITCFKVFGTILGMVAFALAYSFILITAPVHIFPFFMLTAFSFSAYFMLNSEKIEKRRNKIIRSGGTAVGGVPFEAEKLSTISMFIGGILGIIYVILLLV